MSIQLRLKQILNPEIMGLLTSIKKNAQKEIFEECKSLSSRSWDISYTFDITKGGFLGGQYIAERPKNMNIDKDRKIVGKFEEIYNFKSSEFSKDGKKLWADDLHDIMKKKLKNIVNGSLEETVQVGERKGLPAIANYFVKKDKTLLFDKKSIDGSEFDKIIDGQIKQAKIPEEIAHNFKTMTKDIIYNTLKILCLASRYEYKVNAYYHPLSDRNSTTLETKRVIPESVEEKEFLRQVKDIQSFVGSKINRIVMAEK